MATYKLLWAMFYAQQDFYAKEKRYLREKESFFLTDEELKGLSEGAEITVEATTHTFRIAISVPEENVRYVVDNLSKFTREPITAQK